MKTRIALTIAIAAFFALALAACGGPATLTALKTTKDKEGKTAASTYKAGEVIYASAEIGGGSKSSVKFTLIATEDADGVKKGEALPKSDVKVDMPGGGTAQYQLTIPAGFQSGKFTVNAELVDDKGAKVDTKTAAITIEGAPAPAAPPANADDKGHDDKDAK